MKILQLCNKSPFPPLEGGPIAMNSITTSLIDYGHKVKVLAVNSYKYQVDPSKLPADYVKSTNIEFVFVDLRIKKMAAFLNLFTFKSYHIERFKSKDFQNKLIEILQNETFDVVQIETIFLTPYITTIRKYSKAKIVLRAHNIEHLIWKRLQSNCTSLLKKIYLIHIVRTLKMYELKVVNQLDGVITISKPDLDFFVAHGCKSPIKVIPFGISKKTIDAVNPTFLANNFEKINIGYIGSMNWMPNIEGVEWFLNHVWEPISRQNNKLIFNLAGRFIPKHFYDYQIPNFVIHGEVESASEFINSNDIMIAPLFSGSGIRIKIIESMLQGKPVITTTVGAEGINFTDRHDVLIANTADEFIDAITILSQNSDLRKIVGTNAHELIHLNHNMSIITPLLIEFYKSLPSHE